MRKTRSHAARGSALNGAMLWLAVLLVALGASPVVHAGEGGMTFSGEVTKDFVLSLKNGELTRNGLGYDISLDGDLAGRMPAPFGHLYISFNGSYDLIEGSGDLFELGEAYIDLYRESLDLRVGQQVVSWGTAYGVNPTNYVNPIKVLNPEDMMGEMEIKGIPVPAVYGTGYTSWGDTGGVLVLDPKLQDIPVPSEMQAKILEGVARQASLSLGGLIVEAPGGFPAPERPTGLGQLLEVAGRAGTRVGGWDVYASAFKGWDDYPVLWARVEPKLTPGGTLAYDSYERPVMELQPHSQYRRLTRLGATVTGVIGDYTLWGEASYTWPERVAGLEDERAIAFSSNEPYLQAVVGGDRNFENNIYAMAQYIYNGSGSLLSPYWFKPGPREAGQYLLGVVRYTPNDDHEVELTGLVNLDDKSSVIAPRYTYHLSQSMDIWAGGAFFAGCEDSEFGMLKGSKALITGVKFSF